MYVFGEQEQEAEQARLAGEVERSSEKIAEIDLGLAEKKAMAEQVFPRRLSLSPTYSLSLFLAFSIPLSALLPLFAPFPISLPWSRVDVYPGVELRANLKSIPHICHLFDMAFEWELTEEIIHLPLGCFQGGSSRSSRARVPRLRPGCCAPLPSRRGGDGCVGGR